MKLYEITQQREIVLVSGNLCSGKTEFCRANYPDYKRITVSDIVKSLSNETERSELGKTAHLDSQIAKALANEISKHDKVIVDGIRQLSIVKMLENYFGADIKKVIWLDVPEDVRRQRFEKRGAAKDNMDFDTSMKSDQGLGIDHVEKYFRNKGETQSNN